MPICSKAAVSDVIVRENVDNRAAVSVIVLVRVAVRAAVDVIVLVSALAL